MGKNTKIAWVSAIVLLYTLPLSNNAYAGFFDWLTSKEGSDSLLISSSRESTPSFEDNLKASFEKVVVENQAEFKIIRTHVVQASGYSSTPDQTDSTPFTTASGEHVRDGIIAANIYVNGRRIPFGTLVRIPAIYGDKVFVVEDRMNVRYQNNIDIWFPERQLAKEFGRKKVTIEIVEES